MNPNELGLRLDPRELNPDTKPMRIDSYARLKPLALL